VGCMARGAGCILEDDWHQSLPDGCLPAPGGLGPLPTWPTRGIARCLAHKVGSTGCDDLEAVRVGAWWHKAEILGGLHCKDFRQWDFLAGHRTSVVRMPG
jgi:hypothetical protein